MGGSSSAIATEVRSLTEKLLHVCEAIRPGKFLVRRMLSQVRVPPGQPWEEIYTNVARGERVGQSEKTIRLSPEWLDDV